MQNQLVLYLLTWIDEIKFELLFERPILVLGVKNVERVEHEQILILLEIIIIKLEIVHQIVYVIDLCALH